MGFHKRVCWLGIAVAVAAVAAGRGDAAANEKEVRPAYCAGSWYPGNAKALAQQVDELLTAAPDAEIAGKPIAIIAPHAGYRYSAPVAAAGYRALRGHSYKRVIALAFSHRNAGRYQGLDVPRSLTAYATPLGEVPIDREVCDQLLKNPGFVSDPDVDRGEHSLELQLPFLQRVLSTAASGEAGPTTTFKLVPLYVGRMSTKDYAAAAEAIAPWIDKDTLLVASSDFTHFGPRFGYTPFSDDKPEKLQALGDQGAAPILECDFDGFAAHLEKTGDTICGRGPIQLLLRILSVGGGAQGVRAAFDTSGNMTGDWSNSVTYQSIVFTRRPGTLGVHEREELLQLARRTVTAHLSGSQTPKVDTDQLPAGLRADGACFVTLENHGRLRGCIGNMQATGPLYKAVIRNAVSACQDYRFLQNPVTAAELDQLDIEISYLTPMKRVEATESIVVGRHGLLIGRGPRRGVLLPQVAARRGWTREDFLAQTCRKAGLPLDAWEQEGTEIYCFEAEVFGEGE